MLTNKLTKIYNDILVQRLMLELLILEVKLYLSVFLENGANYSIPIVKTLPYIYIAYCIKIVYLYLTILCVVVSSDATTTIKGIIYTAWWHN